MNRHRVLAICTAIAALATAPARAASIIPPRDLGELAATSQAVVLGEPVATRTLRRGPLLFTETTFAVDTLVKGGDEHRRLVTVLVPGGDLGTQGWVVAGAPRFQPGERYLLMLAGGDPARMQLRMLSWGVLKEVRGRDGSVLLQPVPEAGEVEAFPRADGGPAERPATYRRDALLRHLADVGSGAATWSAAAVVATPEQMPLAVAAAAPPSACRYMTSSPPYTRWRAFDPGQAGSVTIYADSAGDPSMSPGNGFSQVQSAISAWNGTTTSINILYGGTTGVSLGCDGIYNEVPSGSPEYPPFGTNVVVFADPCSDIPDLSGCSGYLGIGGPYWSGSHTYDGATWSTITGWFVILNNGVGCLGSTNYTIMVTHEMGHGLGFGHVDDPNALMYPMCCHPINSTDEACAEYTYPTADPVPPPAPTGVQATDGTYTDRVRVTWNSASGATSYKVFRNTSNDSGTATQIASPGGTSHDDYGVTPGTAYWYWVKATNTYGDSGFSSSNDGFAATCPGAPAAPALDAPSAAGSGQSYSVTWTSTSPDNSYEVQEDDNPSFSSPSTYSVAGTSRSFSNAPGTYYYRARARDDCGGSTSWSGWSNSDSTQVVACGTPAAPAISAPAGADSGAAYTVSWSAVATADSYEVQEATNAAFTGAQSWIVTATSRGFSHTAASATTYYYRVRARDDCGGSTYVSAWSSTGATTVTPCVTPAAPVLGAPASAPAGQSYTVSWTATSPDPAYELQQSTDAGFASPTTYSLTGTSRAFTNAPPINTTFYYRARALNVCGGTTYYSLWSNTATVQVTVCSQVGAPSLASPASGAKVAAPSVTLSWGAVAGAASYDVHFGPGEPPLVATVTGTSHAVSVAEGQSYSWKIVARNACSSAASAVRSFTVCSAPAPPAANFTWSPQGAAPGFPSQQQPYVGQTVQFTDLSTNAPTAWSWYDFQGAGVTYTVQHPTHAWSTAGGKNVRLIATNCQGSSAEVLKSVTIHPDTRAVTADFSWSPAAERDVPVVFTAMQGYAYGDPTAFTWTFKDDGGAASGGLRVSALATATGPSVTHTFACGGAFEVVLTARRGSFQQTTTKTVAVAGDPCCSAPSPPTAAFSVSPLGADPDYPQQMQPYVGQTVHLTDQSTGSPTGWSWSGLPGDAASTEQSPSVVWSAPGTYTVSLTASNCRGASTPASRAITVHPDIRPMDRRFDFGTSTSPVEPGYTGVTHTTAYSAARGWGWIAGAVDSRNRTSGTDLSRDLVFAAEATFAVDVPIGIYDVTLTAGDAASAHDQVAVILEGEQLDTITTARNQWAVRVYHVAAVDGQLTLTLRDLGGADKFFAINALTVATAPTRRFDFGVAGSPTAAGYVPVPSTQRYSPARGYGWLSGSVGGRDRAKGDALARDIAFSPLATFALDLPNGEYDVTVRIGDMGAGHDQAGVFLEGAFAASLTTAAGQIEVRTFRTAVADGQLTLLLDDLGGADANVAIVGLEVANEAPPASVVTLPGGVRLELTRVPAGTFAMGSPEGERGRSADEGPQHDVRITRAFWIGATEVTQAQWQAVMGTNPAAGAGIGPDLPVYNVAWNAVAGPGGFIERLNQHLAATAQVGAGSLRLPTEAEWEYAARAGSATRFAFGDAAACDDGCGPCEEAAARMWWCGNAGSANHPAASLAPNGLGIFDAHGNVWEWVADRWGPYTAGLQLDPTGPASGAYRVVRGGDSFGGAADCRAARREYQAPAASAGNIGLRLARGE